MKIAFFPPIPSATGSEQDVVMEAHKKVRFWGFMCVWFSGLF